jgi:hypothetical protein
MKTKYLFFLLLFFLFLTSVFLIYKDREELTLLIQNLQSVSPTVKEEFPTPSPVATTSAILGVQNKTRDCVVQNYLPDPECTPGAIFPHITKEDICVSGYSAKARNVSSSTKAKVYTAYNISYPPKEEYEIDHLISLQLGGSNDVANLWPEMSENELNANQKDRVENYLHKQVCDGIMPLSEAQFLIAQDWVRIYSLLEK